MNLEPFCELCVAAAENDETGAKNFCKSLTGLFDDDIFEDMKKVCILFYGDSGTLGKAKYHRRKKYITNLYQWLYQEGKVSKAFCEQVAGLTRDDIEPEEELNRYYFKDLDSLIGYVNEIGRRRSLEGSDALLTVKVIAVLVWHQIDVTEMVAIQKSDLDFANKTVQIHNEGGVSRLVTLEDRFFDLLMLYAGISSGKSYPSQAKQSYQYSKYLLQTPHSPQMNSNSVACTLKRFNRIAQESAQLKLSSIRINGVFYAVLQIRGDMSINAAIMEIAHCDKYVASGYAKLYNSWYKKFYEEEELPI